MDAALQQQATGVEVVTDFAPKAIARRRRDHRNRMALVATAYVAAFAVADVLGCGPARPRSWPGPPPRRHNCGRRPPPACPRRFPPRGPPPRRRHCHHVVGAVRDGHVSTITASGDNLRASPVRATVCEGRDRLCRRQRAHSWPCHHHTPSVSHRREVLSTAGWSRRGVGAPGLGAGRDDPGAGRERPRAG